MSQQLLKLDTFASPLTVGELQRTDCVDVPAQAGVYVVLWAESGLPRFLSQSTGGRFKNREPSVPLDYLKARWCATSSLLYIGKAGGGSSKATLRQRLRAYMNFGLGKPVGHWGGRLIWQLAESERLLVRWRSVLDEDPRTIEKTMIAAFQACYGQQPFANLTG